jgi:transposase-like protein
MTKAGLGKSTEARIQYWRARIAEQERSGMSVGRFCQEQQITEQSFYVWRKRLRQPEPVRFALVERGAVPIETAAEPALELVLKTGERLRIGRSVDEVSLRTVLAVLRP